MSKHINLGLLIVLTPYEFIYKQIHVTMQQIQHCRSIFIPYKQRWSLANHLVMVHIGQNKSLTRSYLKEEDVLNSKILYHKQNINMTHRLQTLEVGALSHGQDQQQLVYNFSFVEKCTNFAPTIAHLHSYLI